MTRARAMRMVRISKHGGDDAYSWALFVGGVLRFAGMDKREATWRRQRAVDNLTAGRAWAQDR